MRTLIHFIGILLVLRAFSYASDLIVRDRDDDLSDSPASKTKAQMFNFASQAAGAVVLDKSPASAKGYHNLLNDDKDKYGISPCDEKKWVVIGLSEEVLITSVELLNYEKYSSVLRDFQLLASSSYPTDEWINLGTYTALPQLGSQSFNITDLSEAHTRYLKVKFLTHYSDEALCTLSQIKVFGMTVIAAFQQEVQRSDHSMRDMLSQLNSEQPTAQLLEVLADTADSAGSAGSVGSAGSAGSEATTGGEQPGESLNETMNEAPVDVALGTALVGESEGTSPQPPGQTESESPPAADSATTVTPVELGGDVGGGASAGPITGDRPQKNSAADGNGTQLPPLPGDSAAVDATATPADNAPVPTRNSDPIADPASKPEAAVVISPTEDDLDGPRFVSFDLAGKVKKLLPGFFSAPESPAAEDAAVKEVDGEKEEKPGSAAVVLENVPEAVAAQNDTGVRDGVDGTADAPSLPVAGTNSSTEESVPVQGDSGEGSKREQEVRTLASEANAAPTEAQAPAPNATEVSDSISTGALNTTNEDTVVTAVASNSATGNKPESANGSTAESPASQPTVVSPADRVVNRSAEVPKANISTAVANTSIVSKLSNGGVNTTGALGVVASPLPAAAAGAGAGVSNTTLHCLDTLSFADFSRKMRAKLQQYGANSGNSSSNSTSSNTTEEVLSGKESNVFKSLMQKIKTLEMNSAIVEMYAVQMSECFRTVAKELAARATPEPSLLRTSSRVNSSGRYGRCSAVGLISLAWKVASNTAEARSSGETELLAELVWEFIEDNLPALLLCGMMYILFTFVLAVGLVYVLLKSPRV